MLPVFENIISALRNGGQKVVDTLSRHDQNQSSSKLDLSYANAPQGDFRGGFIREQITKHKSEGIFAKTSSWFKNTVSSIQERIDQFQNEREMQSARIPGESVNARNLFKKLCEQSALARKLYTEQMTQEKGEGNFPPFSPPFRVNHFEGKKSNWIGISFEDGRMLRIEYTGKASRVVLKYTDAAMGKREDEVVDYRNMKTEIRTVNAGVVAADAVYKALREILEFNSENSLRALLDLEEVRQIPGLVAAANGQMILPNM